MFVYTIQPVVNPVVKRVWQPVWQPCWTNSHCSFVKQPLFVQPVVKPGCTTGSTTGCIHDTAVCQTGCQTGLTTGWMFVYTIQPVVKPVWQPDWQQVVSCKRGLDTRINPCRVADPTSYQAWLARILPSAQRSHNLIADKQYTGYTRFNSSVALAQVSRPPFPSNRHHRSSGDCLEGKRENYQVCSV